MSTMTGKIKSTDKIEIHGMLEGILGKFNTSITNKQETLEYLLNPEIRDKLLDLMLLHPEFKSEVSSKIDITEEETLIEISEKKGKFKRKKIKINGTEKEYLYKKEKISVYLNCKKDGKPVELSEYYERDGKKYIIRQIEDINNIVSIQNDEYVIENNATMDTLKSYDIIGSKKYKIYGNYYISSMDDNRNLKRNKNVLLEVTEDGFLKPANFHSEKLKRARLDSLIFDLKRENKLILPDENGVPKEYILTNVQTTKSKKNGRFNSKTYNLTPADGSDKVGRIVYISLKTREIIEKGKKRSKIPIIDFKYDYDQLIVQELLNVNAFGEYNKKNIEEILKMAYKDGSKVGKQTEDFFSSYSGNNANLYNVSSKNEDLEVSFTVLNKMKQIKYVLRDSKVFDIYEEYLATYNDFEVEFKETSDYLKYNEKEVKYEKLKNKLKVLKRSFNDRLEELEYTNLITDDLTTTNTDTVVPNKETPIEEDVETEVTETSVSNEDINEELEEDTFSEEANNEAVEIKPEKIVVANTNKYKRREDRIKEIEKKKIKENETAAMDFLKIPGEDKARDKFRALVEKAMTNNKGNNACSNIYSK